MGAKMTMCCCRYLNQNMDEKNAILRIRYAKTSRPAEPLSNESNDSEKEDSVPGPLSQRRNSETNQELQRSTDQRRATIDITYESPLRRGSDRELQAFISMRDQADKATEEWEKLNYDIHTLRYERREVKSRWKKILLQLGYQCEADALLFVNKQSQLTQDEEQLSKATELLNQLLNHTCMFPSGTPGQENNYLYVMDRLVSLDSAEDFVRLAKEKYPQKEG